MIPHLCLIKHDPPNSYGDCVRACVASILDIERAEDVPHFFHDDPAPEIVRPRIDGWLSERGLKSYLIFFDGSASFDNVLQHMGSINPDVHYMLFAQSASNDHVVVCCGDKMVHDPAWYRTGIQGPHSMGHWVVMIFVPVILCKK